jgi:hypothetical protein
MLSNKNITKQRKITTSRCTLAFMIKVVVLAVIELKQVLKIVEDLADYIARGVTGEIEKRQWSEPVSILLLLTLLP